MRDVPETLVSFVWFLSNIGVPFCVAMVLGTKLRRLLRWFVGLLAAGLVVICLLAFTGGIALDGMQLAQLKDTLAPCLIKMFAAATKAASRFPAATIGLMLGMLLREFRPHRTKLVSR